MQKKVEKINQLAFEQGIIQGRQSGWNEMFNIVGYSDWLVDESMLHSNIKVFS